MYISRPENNSTKQKKYFLPLASQPLNDILFGAAEFDDNQCNYSNKNLHVYA